LAPACHKSSDTTHIYSLDVKTGKIEHWTEGETGRINTQNFSLPEVVRWKTFDGRMISGLYYKPPGEVFGASVPS